MDMILKLLMTHGKVIMTTNSRYDIGATISELESFDIDQMLTVTIRPLRVTRIATKAEYFAQLGAVVPKGYIIAAIGLKRYFYEVKPD